MDYRNAAPTRHSGILNALLPFCGPLLTPDGVDRVLEAVEATCTSGPTAWAFRPEDAAAAERARVRRELLAEIASLKAADRHFLTSRLDGNGVMTAAIHEDDLHAALDRILPEGE